MAASDWSVLIFGDSWAEYMHPCWPQVLGRRLGAKTFNFANAGSMCKDLIMQAQRALMSPQVPKAAGGLLRNETLIVIHTCGNDFIMKMAEGFMGGGGLGMLFGGGGGGGFQTTPEFLEPNPGASEITVLSQFLETMHRAGGRHFLVSGVPIYLEMPIWNMLWPILGGMVNSGRLEALGVSPGDPPRLAVEVQASALHERWEHLVKEFSKKYPDSICVFFDEVAALERLREKIGAATFDRSMWDFSMFHPTAYGHEQIADEAHRSTAEAFPVLCALAPHPNVSQVSTPSTAPSTQQDQKSEPITIQVRNVKGDVTFSVRCDGQWTARRLREEVLSTAPSGFASPGATCVIALKGKFLGESPESLSSLGLVDGGQIIAVVKMPQAK